MTSTEPDLFTMECRFCREMNGCNYPPGQACLCGDEPGWIITCDRCLRTTVYRGSEVQPLEIIWGPPIW